MYTALVLTEESRQKLLAVLNPLPKGFEYILHHMTINMGSCKDKDILNKPFQMKVTGWAGNEKVTALRVESPCESVNKVKHITMAVNRSNGGKPVMSNNFKEEDWQGWPENVQSVIPVLLGTVQECQ